MMAYRFREGETVRCQGAYPGNCADVVLPSPWCFPPYAMLVSLAPKKAGSCAGHAQRIRQERAPVISLSGLRRRDAPFLRTIVLEKVVWERFQRFIGPWVPSTPPVRAQNDSEYRMSCREEVEAIDRPSLPRFDISRKVAFMKIMA